MFAVHPQKIRNEIAIVDSASEARGGRWRQKQSTFSEKRGEEKSQVENKFRSVRQKNLISSARFLWSDEIAFNRSTLASCYIVIP